MDEKLKTRKVYWVMWCMYRSGEIVSCSSVANWRVLTIFNGIDTVGTASKIVLHVPHLQQEWLQKISYTIFMVAAKRKVAQRFSYHIILRHTGTKTRQESNHASHPNRSSRIRSHAFLVNSYRFSHRRHHFTSPHCHQSPLQFSGWPPPHSHPHYPSPQHRFIQVHHNTTTVWEYDEVWETYRLQFVVDVIPEKVATCTTIRNAAGRHLRENEVMKMEWGIEILRMKKVSTTVLNVLSG